MHSIELPLLPATALDPLLIEGGGSKHAVQKLRQELRKEFDTPDTASFHSFGRHGTTNLEPFPFLACLLTGTRWGRDRARLLARVYNDAGLDRLLHSDRFARAMHLAAQVLRAAARVTGYEVALAVETLTGLTANNAEFRSVAEEMSDVNRKVDQHLREVRRIPGTLVRTEGDQALVVLETGDREELRELSAALLRATGIVDEGGRFILYEMNWSADTRSLVAFPAVDIDVVDQDLERRLAEAETPLPSPATVGV